ncbi:MAG: hypothetical protein ACRCTJ_06985, partial [Brevinema sp.]
MKKIQIKIALLLLMTFTGCSLVSRSAIKFGYQDQQFINTLDNGPLKTISANGVFDINNYESWDFQKETMTLHFKKYEAGILASSTMYTLEIVADNSVQDGIIRVYGNGPLNSKFIGISALTNGTGAFFKFSIQDTDSDIINNARSKPHYEYVANVLIYQLHVLFENKKIILLNSEEFFNSENYTSITPVVQTDPSGKPCYIYKRETFVSGTTTPDSDVVIKSVKILPLAREVYQVDIDGKTVYLGLEFSQQNGSSKLKMVHANNEAGVSVALENLKHFNYQFEGDADLPNRVIQVANGNNFVKLRKSAGTPVGEGTYYWEGTEELLFDAKAMTLKVISTFNPTDPTVPSGVTNIYNYKIKMVRDNSGTRGIFSITGSGEYHSLYAALRIEQVGGKLYADFKINATEAGAQAQLDALNLSPTLDYQDKITAEKPYRLVINLESIGKQWVQLTESELGGMEFDSQNTEI